MASSTNGKANNDPDGSSVLTRNSATSESHATHWEFDVAMQGYTLRPPGLYVHRDADAKKRAFQNPELYVMIHRHSQAERSMRMFSMVDRKYAPRTSSTAV
ncbi:uncharacterized protein N7529_003498 [Penicillium soppii]|uniref:uncharacterized protein n=1 Tax=Penicillium soppii TaxID=69789 RepID=UPI002546E73F|nr:uncharacterized protein N7529_003498 [Penicillium soppii]KAJ5871145.1 hypothetical protein N7529_003498 [Penicillium soppii]